MKASISVMAFTVPTLERHQIKKNARSGQCLMGGWFVVCFDYYEDQVSSERVNKAPVMVNIFLDEDNDFQLPKVVHFMKTRFGNVTIPPEILQCGNASLIRREDEKIPLCSDMLGFGECKIRQFDCTYRHVFNASDAPSEWLPKWGYVRMRILSVVSPLQFKVHILHTMKSHIDPFDKWTAVNESDKYFAFQNNLNGHMMQAENQMTPASRDVQMGHIYLFKFEHNYLRVRIESCVMDRAVLLATITSIDVAKIVKKTCPSNDLLTLPEQFCNFPQQLIDIRLFGLEPNDHEMLAFIGHIELTMRETIYVKSLQCVEFFDSNQTNFVKWSVKGEILKNKLAVESPADRMFFISDLVKQYGIHTAKSEEMMMSKNQEKPRETHVKWMRVLTEALMDANILDFTALDEFYVLDLSAVARLKELQRKIREFTASELKVKETIKVGDNCLVPLDTMFCRGKVWKETDQVDEFHVFLVDEGHIAVYNASQIYEISTKLTEEYPFFAIRCSLLGVTEPIPQLTNDDLDEIYEKFIQGPSYRSSLQIYPVEEVIVSTGGEELPDMLPEDPAVAIPENGLRDYLEFEKPLPELLPQQDNSSIASTTSNTDQRVLFEIKPLRKAPLVEWHQNFEEIFLKITAVEMKDYHLVVQQRFLSLTLIFPDRPQQGFVLNFFGCISPKSTQIKVKPNYLIVRLKKTIGGREFMWADLVDPPEKLHWLKRIIYEATSDLSDCPAEFSKFDTYKKCNSDRNSDSYDEEGSDSDDGLLI
ncbi:Putative ATP-dependent RNA helicase BoYb [Sergentomyia squamirostris]